MAKKKATAKAVEEVKEVKAEEVVEEKVEEEVKADPTVIGQLKGGRKVHQAVKTVKFKAVRGPIAKDKLPKHLQAWLTNKGYGTNVYTQPKEWLEKHKVDPEKLAELKKFINDNYL